MVPSMVVGPCAKAMPDMNTKDNVKIMMLLHFMATSNSATSAFLATEQSSQPKVGEFEF